MKTKVNYKNINSFEEIQNMKWGDFECLCKDLLRGLDFKEVEITKKGPKGGDDGIDLKMKRNGQNLLGQCKRWTKNHGLIHPIRELGGSLKKYELEKGLFFVSIKANKYEYQEARNYGVELWDIEDILKSISLTR
jgi:restriction system protein